MSEEALSLYQQHRPDVLFLDINLPHLDGLTLAQRIREKDKNVKIIMLTAHKKRRDFSLCLSPKEDTVL
ncbi:MAG: response regulator [Sulfurovaceae bacterium]|nr:response regulator [Sulfurovaceae bacterium]